eukprot:gene20409-biopygen19110
MQCWESTGAAAPQLPHNYTLVVSAPLCGAQPCRPLLAPAAAAGCRISCRWEEGGGATLRGGRTNTLHSVFARKMIKKNVARKRVAQKQAPSGKGGATCSDACGQHILFAMYREQMTAGARRARATLLMLTPRFACVALPCAALPCLALPCLALPCLALPSRPGETARHAFGTRPGPVRFFICYCAGRVRDASASVSPRGRDVLRFPGARILNCAGWPSQLLLTQLGQPSQLRRPWRSRVADDATSSRGGEGDCLTTFYHNWCPDSLAKVGEFGHPPLTSARRNSVLTSWSVRRDVSMVVQVADVRTSAPPPLPPPTQLQQKNITTLTLALDA